LTFLAGKGDLDELLERTKQWSGIGHGQIVDKIRG
jgi:hypothetical protein